MLTSQLTFSSGNWFGVILGDNALAEIVGERTGNAPTSAGDILRFQAPHSRYVFTVSHKEWVRPDRARDPADTLTPDLLVPVTREDIRGGGQQFWDVHLRRVLDALAGR